MLSVHQTKPAGHSGQWLHKILQPVADACGFVNPPPVEIRPTGQWGGWCETKSHAPDGRICMSSRIVFWNREAIISIYLHECSHRLLTRWPIRVPSHGPVFFALNSILVDRCKSSFRLEYQFAKMDFYDLQDRPPEFGSFENWQEICLRFARETKANFSVATCSAEELAVLVVLAWPKFLAMVDDEQKVRSQAAKTIKDSLLISAKREKYITRLEGWLLSIIATVSIAFLVTIWVWLR